MKPSTTLFDLDGNPYDISSPAIRCRAEMAGATVFVVEGRIGKLRVLDFSEREAELTYRDEVSSIACPGCGGIQNCNCDADDPDDVDAYVGK